MPNKISKHWNIQEIITFFFRNMHRVTQKKLFGASE